MSVVPFPPMKRPLVAILRGVSPEETQDIVSELIDNFLASAEFFDHSAMFQKCSEKRPSDLCPSWHRQLFEHSAFVAHLRARQR